MSLRLLIIIVAMLMLVGVLPFLMQQAAQPHVFKSGFVEDTLSWSDGPDVALNTASLRKLNAEVAQVMHRELPGELSPVQIVSLGKRSVEITYFAPNSPPRRFS